MAIPDIAFIGAGNMAGSIIGGLLQSGHPPAAIRAADPDPAGLQKLKANPGLRTFEDNASAATGADVVIMAVKPQVLAAALEDVSAAVAASGALVISIAAGITIDAMRARLGPDAAIVRCMPNTPALLGCGASALFASAGVNDVQRNYAETILGAVGSVTWVGEESDLDAVTALSGSGPAYFFLFLEAMIDAAQALGLDRETATTLAQQTALGAARMSIEGDADLVELRRRVTSPGGTTEAAVTSFERDGLRNVVARAMQAAARRAGELAQNQGQPG